MCFLVDAHARAPHHQLFSRVLLVKKPIFKVDIRREWKRKLPEHREAQYLYRDYCTLDNVLLLCGHLLCLCSKDISIVSCKNPSVHLPPPTPLSLFQAIKAFVENSKYHFYVCTFIVCLQPRCTYIIITDIKEPDAMDMWICCEWLDITIHQHYYNLWACDARRMNMWLAWYYHALIWTSCSTLSACGRCAFKVSLWISTKKKKYPFELFGQSYPLWLVFNKRVLKKCTLQSE